MFSIKKNFSKPQGLFGAMLLGSMNKGHDALTRWALSFVDLRPEHVVLDVGCGGGNAIRLMAQKSDKVYGIDHSEVSVRKSSRKNADAVERGNVRIMRGSVSKLPFKENAFDWATAFETVYFWPDLSRDFKEVSRVIKPGGHFMTVFQVGLQDSRGKKLESSIPGMKVYTPPQIERFYRDSEFINIVTHEKTGNTWKSICVIGEKAGARP